MKKIFVEKNETVASVAERIVTEPDAEITLVIPKGSVLRESVNNFHLLKREAASAEKSLAIESVDSQIITLAAASHIEASHPLLKSESNTRSFSDIVPKDVFFRNRVGGDRRSKKELPIVVETPTDEFGEVDLPRRHSSRRKVKPIFWGVGLLLLLCLIIFILSTVFARASIVINLKKTPWHYEGTILAGKSMSKISSVSLSLPGEVFVEHKNITQLFPASGRARVAQKSKGIIIIYNAYSSEPQTLVATTRFVIQDGKIFRIDDKVLVPGAHIKDGSIIPASTTANITADQAGDSWNVGPVDRLTIPGFKGSPKYSGFYGSIKEKTSGGFIGERATPTDKDISAAKAKASDVLKSSLASSFLNPSTSGFKIINGASEVTVTRLTVNTNTDPGGNFTTFGEAQSRTIGFRESDLTSLLKDLAPGDKNNVLKDIKIDYRDARPDFGAGQMRFTVVLDALVTTAFNADDLKAKVIGMDMARVQSVVGNVPGLADAKVSLWPIWLRSVPNNPDKVSISAN